MSETLTKLRKRRGCEVKIDDDVFFLRNMMIGELRRVDALLGELKPGFIVGCKLCSGADGLPEFPKLPDEDDAGWATRVMAELEDVSTAKISTIVEWSSKLPKVTDVVKN